MLVSTIAIANQKGGTGKTTTAVTLAHGMALSGFNVLLVDLDPQGNVADCLGLEREPALYQLLVDSVPLREVVVPSGREGLDVLLGDESTAGAEKALVGMRFAEFSLSRALKGADYEQIVLDCAPSLAILHSLAYMASDWVVIPAMCKRLAALAAVRVERSLEEFNEDAPAGGVELLGVLPTFYERVTNESKNSYRELAHHFGELLLPPIPKDTKLSEAPAYGKTIWEYDLRARALVGIEIGRRLVGGYEEVLDIIIEENLGGLGWVQRARISRRSV